MDSQDPTRGDRIARTVAALRSQGATEQDIEAYLTEHEGLKPDASAPAALSIPRAVSESTRATPGHHDVNFAGLPDDTGTSILGTLAASGRDIPLVEPTQAGLRALVRGQPYNEALSDIWGAEDIAGPLATAARIGGATLAQTALPGAGTVKGSALFGAAHGAAKADPTMTLGDRASSALTEGALGAVIPTAIQGLPSLGNKAVTLARTMRGVRNAKPLGAQALARADEIAATDAANFGKARAEAAMIGHQPAGAPAIAEVLQRPDIKPLADELRTLRQFGHADDATILMEVRNRLSEQQSPLANKIAQAVTGKPSVRGDMANLQMAKEELVSAADQSGIPSLRPAVEESARLRGIQRAGDLGTAAGRRIVRAGRVPITKLKTEGPEALQRRLQAMPPEEREAFLAATFGAAKEVPTLSSANPLTGFGALRKATAINRLAPYVEQVRGTSFGSVPRAASASGLAAFLANRP